MGESQEDRIRGERSDQPGAGRRGALIQELKHQVRKDEARRHEWGTPS